MQVFGKAPEAGSRKLEARSGNALCESTPGRAPRGIQNTRRHGLAGVAPRDPDTPRRRRECVSEPGADCVHARMADGIEYGKWPPGCRARFAALL